MLPSGGATARSATPYCPSSRASTSSLRFGTAVPTGLYVGGSGAWPTATESGTEPKPSMTFVAPAPARSVVLK